MRCDCRLTSICENPLHNSCAPLAGEVFAGGCGIAERSELVFTFASAACIHFLAPREIVTGNDPPVAQDVPVAGGARWSLPVDLPADYCTIPSEKQSVSAVESFRRER